MADIKLNLNSLNPKTFKKTVRHKVNDGDNVFRFLPPFGVEADGYPYKKWNVVWGLIDPNSGRARPFASSSTYAGACPVYDYLDLLRSRVEAEQIQFQASGANEEQVKAKFKNINDYISNLRPKTSYAYNAIDKSGTVGVLELKATAHKEVLKEMTDYIKDYNQDPTSLNSIPSDSGLWFKITREGKGFNTKYAAKKNQIMIKDATTGIPSYQDDRSAIAQSVSDNYEAAGYDLNSLYQKLSYEELKEILVANILHVSETMPEVLVEGFGLGDVNISINSSTPNVPVEKTVSTVVPKIKLDTPSSVQDTDDLLAMADDIFNL